MTATTKEETSVLIIPGYRGSGPDHWQSWLEKQVATSRRIQGIDWEQAVLASWAGRIRQEIHESPRQLLIIAHSFGCLAAVTAVADRPANVAGLILVAPASPDRFNFLGLNPSSSSLATLSRGLPFHSLNTPGLLVASRTDAWLDFRKGQALAHGWGLEFHDAGDAGHINEESGFGAWPFILAHVQKAIYPAAPPRTQATRREYMHKGRGSVLARVRNLTRAQLELQPLPMETPYSKKE